MRPAFLRAALLAIYPAWIHGDLNENAPRQATIVLVSSGFRTVSSAKVLGKGIRGNLGPSNYMDDFPDQSGTKADSW